MTGITKRVAPVAVLGALVIGSVTLAATRPLEQTWWSLAMAALFAVVFCLAYRFRIWPLADEVLDGGDHLLVRRRDEEQRVLFSDISRVELSRSGKSHRMTLFLARPGPFGAAVVFLAPKSAFPNPFARDPLELELASRVDAAHGRTTS